MTDINDFAETYKRHLEAQSQANAANKEAVFDALRVAGITSVTVSFDGEGDSGQIEDIEAYRNKEPHPLPDITIEILQSAWRTGKLDSANIPLREAIETLCYDYLSQEQGGWENNDGAFGEFTFDVATRSIGLEFNARYSDFHSSDYTF